MTFAVRDGAAVLIEPPQVDSYSLKAITGSTLAAFSAGMQTVSNATTGKVADAPKKIDKSLTLVW
jgi:hypothetical protein